MKSLPFVTALHLFVCTLLLPPAGVAAADETNDEFLRYSALFEYDRDLPLSAFSFGTWTRTPYILEKVEYLSIRQEMVPAYFAYPKDMDGPAPAILLVHGNNRFMGKHEPWSLEWIEILTGEGYAVLAPDLYGYGERMTRRDREPKGPHALRDDRIQTVVDLRRGIDFLLTRPEVDPNRVALMGGSLGGYLGVLTTSVEDRLAAAVFTVTSGNAMTDIFAPHISISVLMVNATADGKDAGERLFNSLAGPKEIVWYESDHYLPPHTSNEEVRDFLSRRFSATPSRNHR